MSKYRNASLLQQGEKVTDEQLSTEFKLLTNQRAVNRLSRRGFIAAAGAAGTVGLFGCGGSSSTPTTPPTTPPPPTTTTPSVTDVLNFALNLEYLEASFYLYITTGAGLSTADQGGTAATITGGAQVTFTDPNVTALAQELAADEQAHVEFLRGAITQAGSTPVACPSLNLAAMGSITTDAQFLALARQLETVGVSAYEGGVQYLTSNTGVLTAAAQIHDTEGQHEGALRLFCIANGITSGAVDSSDMPPTTSAIFNTSATTGFNSVRTPSQVLQIVYAAAGKTGVSSGGFFPAGLNGNIKTS